MPKGIFKPFTIEEEEKIKAEYLLKPTKHLAMELNVSSPRIKRFLKKNNLEIPKEKIREWSTGSQFKKGHVPFNTGLKQSTYASKEAIERMSKTRFKKGHVPANAKYDGAVSYRRENTPNRKHYKHVRISSSNWKLEHHVKWEEVNGKIPEKHLLIFIDGDTNNTDVSNLRLITNAENMYINSAQNYPKEIIPSLVLLNDLKHKINDLENGK